VTITRQLIRAKITSVGDDEVDVVMSTDALARDGHILIPQGCILANYRANPIVLWSHNPDLPIGNAEDVTVTANEIIARIRFAPLGVSAKADEIRGLMKSGVIRAVSVGFEPIDMEPLDKNKPRGGQRINSWELMEISAVSVPSDYKALVTARGNSETISARWKIGAPRTLPLDDGDEWDGVAAANSIFELAGGDDFDPDGARKGFLVYDAANPGERGSYELPIAHVVGETMKVPKAAIRAAASQLPDTDIPDDVKRAAGKLLDIYKKRAGMMKDDGERGANVAMARSHRTGAIVFARGLYQVASLCYQFEELGYQVDMAKYEAAIEGDDSKVPAMLATILHDLGDALIAMTQEEVAEALAGHDVEPDDDDDDELLVDSERARIADAATPGLRAFRRGLAHAKLRSGKVISAANAEKLREACAMHGDAVAMHRSAIAMTRKASAMIDDMLDGEGDDATDEVQTSEGDGENEGDKNERADADFRKRQADMIAISLDD
jgi:HK97 family phage prohead protease